MSCDEGICVRMPCHAMTNKLLQQNYDGVFFLTQCFENVFNMLDESIGSIVNRTGLLEPKLRGEKDRLLHSQF